jgi:hypothetical protein
VKFKDEPLLEEVTQQLATLASYLPALVALQRSLLIYIDRPIEVQMYPEVERVCAPSLSFPTKQCWDARGNAAIPSIASCSTVAETEARSEVGSDFVSSSAFTPCDKGDVRNEFLLGGNGWRFFTHLPDKPEYAIGTPERGAAC